jgi:hypothetical protein
MAAVAAGQRAGSGRLLLLLFLMLALAACTQTRSYRATGYSIPIERPASILLIEPDVEVGLVTTGGLLEPNAEWTEQARTSLLAGLQAFGAERGFSVKRIDQRLLPAGTAALFTDYERLHGAVGSAIAQYKYGSVDLPTKRDRFDWTMGPGTARLGEAAGGATHALFLVARDSFASTGRVVMNILAAALFGGVPGGGQRVAYASLVDLRTGDIVWFNVMQSDTGDMRTPEGARETIDTLFRSMPTAQPQPAATGRAGR